MFQSTYAVKITYSHVSTAQHPVWTGMKMIEVKMVNKQCSSILLKFVGFTEVEMFTPDLYIQKESVTNLRPSWQPLKFDLSS